MTSYKEEGLTESIIRNSKKIGFHTPGHGGKLDDVFSFCDVTELSYTDNLIYPCGKIIDLEKKLASVYNAEACFISTQGATHNVHQAVYATKDDGDFLIIGKAHVSVYNAMRLFGVNCYHVDTADNLVLPDSVKTVIVTSPDYFGNCLDLKKIRETIKNRTLIVDSAHGSHFAFSKELPDSATEYGDLVILSLHKTLPVATGGSVLCVKKRYFDKALLYRKLAHTTSPSFVTLCTIERAVNEFSVDGERIYLDIKRKVAEFKGALRNGFRAEDNDDFSRVVISSPYDGVKVSEYLEKKGFVAEMSYESKVVLIVTKYNAEYLKPLAEALNEARDLPLYEEKLFPFTKHVTPVKLFFGGEAERIAVKDAKGRRAFAEIGFYPPGVPLVYAGEVVTEEVIDLFCNKNCATNAFGLENGAVYVLK